MKKLTSQSKPIQKPSPTKKAAPTLKVGDMVIYAYHYTTNHPLGGKKVVIALEVKDVTSSDRYVETVIKMKHKQIFTEKEVLSLMMEAIGKTLRKGLIFGMT